MTTSTTDVLARAREFSPTVRAAADHIEGARQIPFDLVEQMREVGLFHLAVPASYGGVEADPVTASRVVAPLAHEAASA